MIKNLISLIIIILGCFYMYDQNLFNVQETIRDFQREVVIPEDNNYKKNVDVSYVHNTERFIPNNKQELLNIYYTVINSGWREFTFYCGKEYTSCIEDVQAISKDSILLSHLNSFVDPYNSYNNIYTTYYQNGKVVLEISRLYNEYTIEKIEKKLDEILASETSPNNSDKDNIRNIHDYIINNTVYDSLKVTNINDKTHESNTAYGTLIEGYAVCSGYADTMALFLNRLNIPNIKIANTKHVWNLVYLDNKWYHLDLTWDDPVTDDGKQILSHAFFLITTNELNEYNTGDHEFDTAIYAEAK